MEDGAHLARDKRASKMNNWDTLRAWWMQMLTRIKLHVEKLPESFPADKPKRIDVFVAKERAALNTR